MTPSIKKILHASILTVFIAAQTLYPFVARADDLSATQSPAVTAPLITVDMPEPVSQSPQTPGIPITTITTTTPATVTVVTPDVPDSVSSPITSNIQSSDTAPVVIAPVTPTTTAVQSPATGTTTVATGDATSTANVVNIADTTITNSKGSIVLDNLTHDVTAPIDLRSYYASNNTAGNGNTCTLLSCASGEGIAIKVADNTTINNTIVASATTGGNTIDNVDNAAITSGNAYTGVNVLNLANTNIVGSNYLLTLINAFKNVNNDIVFPSLQSFFSDHVSGSSISSTTDNSTAVDNSVILNADSGSNHIAGSNGGIIATGNTASTSSIFNELNATSLGNDSVSLLFKIHGIWNGSVVGLPSTLNIMRGDDGSIYISSNNTGAGNAAHTGAAVSVNSDSNALIHNTIALAALTGNNAINNATNALITTGNAFAGANIANIANTTVVGKNWLFGITNIFGDFNGNIVFGRPDLWIGEKADKPDPVTNNVEVRYTYAIKNKGDATAHHVTVTDHYDAAHLVIDDASVPYTVNNGSVVFNLDTMAPGASTVIVYHAHVTNVTAKTTLTDTATVTETETDNNAADNTDSVSFDAFPPASATTVVGGTNNAVSSGNSGGNGNYVPIIHVIRSTKDVAADSATRSAQESLTVQNDGVTLENDIVLHDIVRAPDGTVTNDENWNVGTLAPGEEVVISYEIDFNQQALPGVYSIDSTLEGFRLDKETFAKNGTVTLSAGNQVLGDSTRLPEMMKYLPDSTHLRQPKILPARITLAPVEAYAADQRQPEKTIAAGDGLADSIIPLSIILLIVLLFLARKYYREKMR
jgi:hypothetical protein